MAALRKNMQSVKILNTICKSQCNIGLIKHFKTSRIVCFDEDPFKYFIRKDVNSLLKKITGYDPEKAFFKHKVEWAHSPRYKVLTDSELKRVLKRAEKLKERRLQMPPFMTSRTNRDKVLDDDPDIACVLDSKYVFVDISEDNLRIKKYGDRPMVIRHTNGKLTTADWKTYDRVLHIYEPVPGREVYMPKMFEEDQLEALLKMEEPNYVYILERACVQFEPDNSEFIRVSHRIYEHVAEHNCFDALRSSRFFGPMAFYFAMINKIEPLMAEMIHRDLLSDAIDLINLKRLLHKQDVVDGDILTIIKEYYLNEANKKYTDVLRESLNNLEKRLNAKLRASQAK